VSGDFTARPANLPACFEPLLLEFFDEPKQRGDWCVLGTDSVCELQADTRSGRVRAFDPRGERPTRFVNSTARQLGGCIDAYGRYSIEVQAARDEAAAREIVARLRSTLLAIDPAATADRETWWSLVLEQADQGLL
jgi:SUKH-4 immunity protein